MKKSLINHITGFMLGGAVCLTACLSIGSVDSEQVKRDRPLVSAITSTPEVPDLVIFCGLPGDVTRYNMHEALDRELSSFTYFHSTTMLMLKRANRYFPIIEPILAANGIPDDFKYLAVIESTLDPRATSPAKAVGMWQILESTGKQYGLTITPTVDERCDVAKSTVAACKYLKDAYKKYGDWPTVAASYNGGMGRISGELNKQNGETSFDLWLVTETTRYVYRILAIKQIFEVPYKYGFVMNASDLYKPEVTEKIQISEEIPDLAAFAKKHGVTYADIRRINPWLRDRKLSPLGKTYTLEIPVLEEMSYRTPNSYVHNPNWVVSGK